MRRLLNVAILLTLLSASCGDSAAGPTARGAVSSRTTSSGTVTYVDLGTDLSPLDVAVGHGSVWVTVRGDQSGALLEVDPETNEIITTTDIADPFRVAVGDDSVWATTGGEGSGTLVEVHPATGRVLETTDIEGGPQELVFAGGAVWVAPLTGGKIIAIDPGSHEEVAQVMLADPSHLAADQDGKIWAVAGGNDTGEVVGIDTARARIAERVNVPNIHFWNRIAAAAGSTVWVARVERRNRVVVHGIDTRSKEPVADALDVGSGSLAIAARDDSVWVWTGVEQTISRIDADSRQVVEEITVTGGGSSAGVAPGLTVGEGALWLTGTHDLIRIDL
ncbi:MAG: hypothetical protein ACRDKZ_15145 [Actinomycetota bacterium]